MFSLFYKLPFLLTYYLKITSLKRNKKVANLIANKEMIKSGQGIIAIPIEKIGDYFTRLIKYYENAKDKLINLRFKFKLENDNLILVGYRIEVDESKEIKTITYKFYNEQEQKHTNKEINNKQSIATINRIILMGNNSYVYSDSNVIYKIEMGKDINKYLKIFLNKNKKLGSN